MKKIFLLIIFILLIVPEAFCARLKDIATIEGVRGNDLFGYGIVIGLNGTGDGGSVDFTGKSVSNLLEKMGLKVDPKDIKVKNVAAVVVTAKLPPFARAGSKIDVTLSSIGDAKSIQGGTLLFTPLKASDGNVYAVAQGPITVGGFSVEASSDSAVKNHPTVGQIAEGATVEKMIPFDLFQSKRVRIVLKEPDFTTVTHIVDALNEELGGSIASAIDGATVQIPLVGELKNDPIGMIAKLEHIDVTQDSAAKVIVNEKTGTIVMGENVKIGKVALAHGNLNIVIRSDTQVSQPEAFSEVGNTEVVTNSDVTVGEENVGLNLIGGELSLGELVKALNALGATPRDLISIFSALKRAGALHADLVIM